MCIRSVSVLRLALVLMLLALNVGQYSLSIAENASNVPPVQPRNAEKLPPEFRGEIDPNTTYYWRIDERDNEGNVTPGEVWSFTTQGVSNPPSNVSASDGTYADRVRVDWDAVSGATEYRVYRSTTNNVATAEPLYQWQMATTYYDYSANPGTPGSGCSAAKHTTYYYWVTSRNSSFESDFSQPDSGWRK